MKKAAAVFLTLIFFVIAATSAMAAGTYSVDSAEFDVKINADGSADVTETWTVNYSDGSFTRFYTDIMYSYSAEGTLDHSSLSVSIDGIPCDETSDTKGRPDYHYALERCDDGSRASAYLAVSAEDPVIHTYEYSYRLNDAVAKLDGNYIFENRLIGADFSKSVPHVNISYTVPDGINIDSQSSAVSYKKGSVLKAKLNMSKQYESSVFESVKKSQNTDGSSSRDTLIFFALSVLVAILICIGILCKKRRKKLMSLAYGANADRNAPSYGKAVEVSDKITAYVRELVPMGTNPLSFAAFLTNKPPLMFPALLADMDLNGYVDIHSNKSIISFPETPDFGDMNPTIAKCYITVLGYLVKCRESVGCSPNARNGRFDLSVESLESMITHSTATFTTLCNNIYWLARSVFSYSKAADHAPKRLLKRKAKYIQKFFKCYKEPYTLGSLLEGLTGTPEDAIEYLKFLYGWDVTDRTNDTPDIIRLAAISLAGYIYPRSTSSSDTSCSSCSSCSSCGGGGAD